MGDERGATAGRTLVRLLLGHLRRYRTGRLQDLATSLLREGTEAQQRVVGVINATLAARQAVTGSLYLAPRRALSRVRFHTRERRRRPTTSRRLSLLCPTRERAGRLADFLRSLDLTVAVGERVEVLCYVDSDDPSLRSYQHLLGDAGRRYPRLGRVVLQVGDPVGVSRAWEQLAASATGEFLMMANDDQLYVDYGWDVTLDRRVAELVHQHPDEILCLYFDGGQYEGGGEDFPIVSNRWYQTIGYFAPTIFQQWSNEKWIFDVARRIGRLYSVPGVFVEHAHYQDYKAPFDATYQRHRLSREKSFADHALFLSTAGDRARDATTLQDVADSFDPRAGASTGPRPSAAPVTSRPDAQPEGTHKVTPTPPSGPVGSDDGTGGYITQTVRRQYSNLIDAWNFGGRAAQARACTELAVAQGVWEDPQQRPREYVAGLETRPVHDPAGFWFVSYLEEQFPQIRDEIEQMLDAAASPVQGLADGAALLRRGDWEQATLCTDGQWQPEMCARFPVTTAILRDIPEVSTFNPGSVLVSRLRPGTHIMPHCGQTNATLRIHLGIRIPDGVRFRVGDQELGWEEGRCLVFDESFEHEVRHDGTEDRVVLIMDTLHPGLGGDERQRLLEKQLTFEEEILAFMKERGLERIEMRDSELVATADAATTEVASLYMAATGITGVEIRGDRTRWRRVDDTDAGDAP